MMDSKTLVLELMRDLGRSEAAALRETASTLTGRAGKATQAKASPNSCGGAAEARMFRLPQ